MNSEKLRHWSQKQKERQRILQKVNKQNSRRHSTKPFFLILLLAVILLTVAVLSFYSYQKYQSEAGLEFSEKTIIVNEGGNFQAALNRAKLGDTILLQAGATFSGAFTLPKKTGNEFITIRSSAADSMLPPPNTRIDPKKHAAALPKLESNVKGAPVILAADGAHHYRFVGIEFAPTIEGLYNIIQLGTGEEKSIEELPHHIEFDRVYIHGNAAKGQRRGIAANGKFIKITNSYISDIKRKDEESQAIAIWATDGPIEIENNYLEAAAENILFGGAGSSLKLVPSNCSVRRNHLNKQLIWREEGWMVKNLFEIKNGKNIRVENNLMTNNWMMGQDGTAILFTTRADNGDATLIADIDFVSNIVRGAANAINVYGAEGGGGQRLSIRNNLFEDINGQKWGSAGYFMKSTDWDGLTIENNTIIQNGSIINAYGKPVKNFVFRNNIVFENEYGIKGDNMGSGQEVIDKLFSNGTVTGNIIIGGKSSRYRDQNFLLDSISQVGFINPGNGDYRLKEGSLYSNKGASGKQIGANLEIGLIGGK